MTPVQFDAETATLRLDRDTFQAQVAHATHPAGEAPHLVELRNAGAVHGNEFHPALQAGLDAILNPVCRLELRRADIHGREDHCEAWVAGPATAFLLPRRDERCELVIVHPSFMPEMLARLAALAPRPRVPAATPLGIGTELLDELTDPDPRRRADAARRVPTPPPRTHGPPPAHSPQDFAPDGR
jgi:hypothetical protein